MIALIVFVICVAIAVFCYKRVAKRCRDQQKGKLKTVLTASLASVVVFIVTLVVGVVAFFPSNKADGNTSTTKQASSEQTTAEKTHADKYTCDKFHSVMQTQQGTKIRDGYYSDGDVKTTLTYTITDEQLVNALFIPNITDSTDSAKFNNIAADGSRKYGSSSTNYFVSKMNDSTIKVVAVNFDFNSTITQTCTK